MNSKKALSSRISRARQKGRYADDVGYGRPPRTHQFKPGESGNPKGRPRGSKNETTILQELLYRKIPVREAGKVRKITVLEAILLRFTEDSLKGNTKSAAFLLNRQRGFAPDQADAEAMHDDDREILKAFADRLAHQRSGKN